MKLVLALLLAFNVSGQDAPKKKPAAKKPPAAHAKPTPEQIRRFNQLEKKPAKK